MTDHTDEIAYLREHWEKMGPITVGNLKLRLTDVGDHDWILDDPVPSPFPQYEPDGTRRITDIEAIAIAKQILRDRLQSWWAESPVGRRKECHDYGAFYEIRLWDSAASWKIAEVSRIEIEALHLACKALSERESDGKD